MTVKADAAKQLFGVKTSHLAWAVIDTGIDARHPAFAAQVAQRLSNPASWPHSISRCSRIFFPKARR